MKALLLRADDVLRARPWALQQGHLALRLLQFVGFIILFGCLYGAVMGSFSGLTGIRAKQMLFSALKVPILLVVTFLISLPSFFVINTLAGLRDDFNYALRALLATQAGLTMVLAAFAPFTILWYVSFADYNAAILFNALMFGLASFTAQKLLRHFYRPLIQRAPRHRYMLQMWLIIYAFVGIQMGWLLRPFIGNPNSPTHFLRQEAWDNAYVIICEIIWKLIAG